MCKCVNINIQEYNNTTIINKLPIQMVYHMDKVNGKENRPHSICIDNCILQEIIELWDENITTTGCCCGHNKLEPYIGVIDNDIDKMINMGYTIQFNPMRPEDNDTFNIKK